MNKSDVPQKAIRILFLADTHIGFDWPVKPRTYRRRRGDDFYNNYLLALKPAFENEVDLVIHGGDLLNRSRLPQYVINRAFEPLLQAADLDIPVFIVPGNHERSKFKLTLFEQHPRVNLFDKPKVFYFSKNGTEIALCGFPFFRGDIRNEFPQLLSKLYEQIDRKATALLCLHHPFDGAEVGPKNFTFINRPDTINPADIPDWIDGVLSGHIHRHQVLYKNNGGKPIPVFYPGSVERTSFAERNEQKGYIRLKISGSKISHDFIQLPTRPMHQLKWDVTDWTISHFEAKLTALIRGLKPNSIVRINVLNYTKSELPGHLTHAIIRKMTPGSMNVDISVKK